MKKIFVIFLMCVIGTAVQADLVSQPYITGDFNGWDPAANSMVDLGGGLWEYTISGLSPGQYQQFKITPGDWSVSAPAANSWYSADATGEVTVTFNTNVESDGWLPEQFRVGVSTEPGTWSLVGDYNGWWNEDPSQLMTPLGDGVYEITQTFAAGNYLLKPTQTGTWDAIGTDGRSIDAWNYYLELVSESEVSVYVDAYAGTMKVDVIPEPASMVLLGLGSMLVVRRKKQAR
ncbi:MAG: PEP-CTERM sorting domain-containing protein [Sedimentisphaerales bacterium]|nr:PEP-CTERM sorting domain-containing protein [Sedimentisphaerales bacterium]